MTERWEVNWFPHDADKGRQTIWSGWEPFAVTQHSGGYRVWVRRLVEEEEEEYP